MKDDTLYKKRFRDVGNDAEYLFLMSAVLRKELFHQLHANVTCGHLGRRKTYDKIKKRFYWCNIVCIKMYFTCIGFVQPVGQEKCPTGKQKHQCDGTMSDIQWNALDLIAVALIQFRKRNTGI